MHLCYNTTSCIFKKCVSSSISKIKLSRIFQLRTMSQSFFHSLFILTLFFIILHKIYASEGDSSKPYKNCLNACHNIPEYFDLKPPITWSKNDECKYQCMWRVEEQRQEWKLVPQKYYGKWPFRRIFFFQEFFSSLFSLLNLFPHIFYLYISFNLLEKEGGNESGFWSRIKRSLEITIWGGDRLDKLDRHERHDRQEKHEKHDRKDKHHDATHSVHVNLGLSPWAHTDRNDKRLNRYWMIHLWRISALISINAWIWSFVFHARDKYITERLDYFSAFSVIISGFLGALLTTFYPKKPTTNSRKILVAFILFTLIHYAKMQFHLFDYGYNMKLLVLFSLGFNILWIRYSIKKWKYSGSKKFIISSVSLIAASMLEIFDFPPLFDWIDAHALWHLCTPFILYVHYLAILETQLKVKL